MSEHFTFRRIGAKTVSTLKKIRKVVYRNITDPYIQMLSYPKTGRTWLRVMIGKVLCEQYGMREDWLLETYHWKKYIKKSMSVNHDDTFQPWKSPHYMKLPTDKSRYAKNKVIFLVRDPRDVVVSFFFEMTKRARGYHLFQRYSGTISEFIRDDRFGVKRIIHYYNIWHQNTDVPQGFLLVRYEDIHRDPHTILRQTLAFMDINDVSDQVINKAVEYAGFENMKKVEAENALKTDELATPNQKDPEAYKVRKGKIGGFVEYLTEDDIGYLNDTIAEMDCAFYPELENLGAASSSPSVDVLVD